MSSIGLIFIEKRELSTLPKDWVPVPLGPRKLVNDVVAKALPSLHSLALSLTVESEEENADPRTISVSGVWGEEEMKIIDSICAALDARFYDAESGKFIEL
jgi:hypothetical protein